MASFPVTLPPLLEVAMWFYAGCVAGGTTIVLHFLGDVSFANAWACGSIVGGIAALGQYAFIAPAWTQTKNELDADVKYLAREKELWAQKNEIWEQKKVFERAQFEKEIEQKYDGVREQNREYKLEIERLQALVNPSK